MHRDPMSTAFALLLIVSLASACGDAVTDPSREGFEANPRLIEGDWATIRQTISGPTRYDAELLPAGGIGEGPGPLDRVARHVMLVGMDEV